MFSRSKRLYAKLSWTIHSASNCIFPNSEIQPPVSTNTQHQPILVACVGRENINTPYYLMACARIVISKAAHYKYTLPREGAGQHDQTSPLNHRLWECFDGVRPQFRTSCSLGHFWKTSPATICISFCICICISQFRTSYSLGHFSKTSPATTFVFLF